MKDQIAAALKGTLFDHLGMRLVEAGPDRIVGELDVAPHLMTTGGRLHGGTMMAFADMMGAIGASLTLPPGAAGTTTIESKTNFFGGAASGTIRAEALPVHLGKQTSCWQTRITDAGGKLLAQITQTQMVLAPRAPAQMARDHSPSAKG